MRITSRVQRATFTVKTAALSGEWGYRVACEKFGAELIDSFPVYSRGPRKGQRKGVIEWIKCDVGGWTYQHPETRGAGVVFPGVYGWNVRMTGVYSDPKNHSVVARWYWDRATRTGKTEVLQTPENAAAMFAAYGQEARYA